MAEAAEKKDTSGNAQGRFVVSLPSDVRTQIDAIGAKLTATLEKETGVAIELTPAQIVQSLIRQALAAQE